MSLAGRVAVVTGAGRGIGLCRQRCRTLGNGNRLLTEQCGFLGHLLLGITQVTLASRRAISYFVLYSIRFCR